jgi:regulator of sigma E protease
MTFFIAFILFVFLVVVHEYGHFLVAKRNGVDVEEFGIGFPPKILGKTFGKGIFRSYYTLNWLPLGGFVKLKGETDSDKRKGSFGAANFWVKTKIILAGVFMNFISAALIFTILAWTGIPSLIDNQFNVASDQTITQDDVSVALVVEDSPASTLGLKTGDKLISIGGENIETAEQLFDLTEKYAGQNVNVNYQRESTTLSGQVQLNPLNSEDSYLGIGPTDTQVSRYTWSAPVIGAGTTVQLAGLTYQGLGNIVVDLFNGDVSEAGDGVAGPVGIIVILKNVGAFGFNYLLFFIGIISLTLAVMNSLPIPALDGGRLFVSGIYKLFKKPLSADTEQRIHGTGFAILMLLILLITWVDIGRVFG